MTGRRGNVRAACDHSRRQPHGHNFEGAEISVGIFFGGQTLEFAVEAPWLFRIGDVFALRSVRGELLRNRAALEEPFQGSNLGALALAAPWSLACRATE